MAYEQILYRVEDRVAVVTLNRPERLNAWTPVMHIEVRAAMRAASDDPEVPMRCRLDNARRFLYSALLN
jgi:enoyl-CoA hydratase/carnithine racemase